MGNSPMACLLDRLRALPPGATRPKVVGFTASPGARDSVVSLVRVRAGYS